jgi:hypothetical protein
VRFEDLDEDDSLVCVSRFLWVINTPFVLSNVFDRIELTDTTLEQRDEAIVMSTEAMIEDKGPTPQMARSNRGIFGRMWSGIKTGFKAVLKASKRVYHAIRTVLSSAVGACRRGVAFLASKISDLFGPIRNFVTGVLRRIRDGIAIFTKGIVRIFHFILRRPVLTWDRNSGFWVMSTFDFDADLVTYATEDSPPSLLQAHVATCLDLATDTGRFLVAAVHVVKSIGDVLSGPVGWFRFAFRVGKLVLGALRDPDLTLPPRVTVP